MNTRTWVRAQISPSSGVEPAGSGGRAKFRIARAMVVITKMLFPTQATNACLNACPILPASCVSKMCDHLITHILDSAVCASFVGLHDALLRCAPGRGALLPPLLVLLPPQHGRGLLFGHVGLKLEKDLVPPKSTTTCSSCRHLSTSSLDCPWLMAHRSAEALSRSSACFRRSVAPWANMRCLPFWQSWPKRCKSSCS